MYGIGGKMSRWHDDDPADCNDNKTLDDLLTDMLATEDFPQDDWFEEPTDQESLQYKDEVVLKLIDALQEYLSFATTRDLLKIIVENT